MSSPMSRSLRAKVGRAFPHGSMRGVCVKYDLQPDRKPGDIVVPAGQGFPSQVIAPGIQRITNALVALHEAREQADDDDAVTIQPTEAVAVVQQAEAAFREWLTVQTEPSAATFLQELLCRSINKR